MTAPGAHPPDLSHDPSDPRHAEEALGKGEIQLQEALSALKEKLDAHLRGFAEGIEGSLTNPLRVAFGEAHRTHARLMEEAGLLSTDTPPDQEATLEWRKVRVYQEGVRKEVMEPLREALGAMDLGKNVTLRWEGFQNGLPRVMEDLPELVVRPEPPELYGPRPGEGSWISVRKAGVRAGRRVRRTASAAGRFLRRVLGGSTPPPSPQGQGVPLRALTRRCLLTHCPMSLEPFSEAFHQYYALPLSTLTSRFMEWAREWYPAVDAYHTPSDHLSPETLTRLLADLAAISPPEPQEENPDTGSGEAEDEEESRASGMTDPRSVAGSLHEILARGASLDGPVKPLARVREVMEGEWEHLLREVGVAGSFQATPAGRGAAGRVRRLDARIQARGALWTEWHSGNLQRFNLVFSLMRVREGWDRAQDQLLEPLARELILPVADPWIQARNELLVMEEEVGPLLSPEEAGDDLLSKVSLVEEAMARADGLLKTLLLDPMDEAEAEEMAWAQAEAAVGILSDTLRATPPLLTFSAGQEEPDRVEPGVEVRKAPLRENLLKIVDVVRLEAVRTTPEHILEIFEGARNEYREIPKIMSFNLSAARDELTGPPDQQPPSQTVAEAANLVTEGLARTASAIQGLLKELPHAWEGFMDEAHGFFTDSFREIHRRTLVEGFVQEQILDLRSRVTSEIRKGLEALRGRWQTLVGALFRVLRRIRVRGIRMARVGRSAVGMAADKEGEAARALEILRASPRLLESLPLVYRKLFSFQPVSDPTLLVGRVDEVDWVNRRFQTWREGAGTPSVLLGRLGSGHTSLLNVLSQTLFQDSRVTRLDLDFRPAGEDEFVRWVWERLELAGDPPGSLAELGPRFGTGGAETGRRVVLFEHLEHLLLRAAGGSDLVERFLAFQARTSGHIFWLSTVLAPAWKYLSKAEPASITMVSTQALSPPSRQNLEEMILSRHQRSGLTLVFQEPPSMGFLLRRRLRTARGEKNKQALLRGDFFERLHRMSQGSSAMAILFWLHALDFSGQDGKVRVRTPRNVVFAFLDDMDMSLEFALMALMEHGSLTLDEYARVFRASTEEAWQVFESLRSRMILEPLAKENSLPRAVDTVHEGIRYRIPPILGEVVAQRLRNRNIMH